MLFAFMGSSGIKDRITSAAALVTMPVIVLVLFVQDHIVQNLKAGGIKG